MRQVVGFSQKTKRAWLDALLDKLVQTTDETDLRNFLEKYLKDDLPGKESRAKSTGIALRIWSGILPERRSLRDRAVAMLPRISGQERIWLHWGMTALAYPFFRDAAEVVGRLLALQDDFTTAQVQARMLTTWGDRSTTREAAQKILNTLVDWEVLRPTKAKGHFLLSRKMNACTPELQLWLLEALLAASAAGEIEAQQLLRLPESFPFTISVGVADLRRYESFNIHRQGLDMDMVAIRKVKAEPPPKSVKKPNKDKKQESHKNEVPQTLPGSADRSLPEHGTVLVADSPFAAPSVECAEHFRDGRYFGCIALTQALLESMIRHVWRIKFSKKPNEEGSLDKNLIALHKKKLISDDWKTKLDQMWADRHSFHYLKLSVESDRRKLEEIARNTLELLRGLEQEFFGLRSTSDPIVV